MLKYKFSNGSYIRIDVIFLLLALACGLAEWYKWYGTANFLLLGAQYTMISNLLSEHRQDMRENT